MDNRSNSSAFDIEGRIYQTEYAIKNVSQGGIIVGMKCIDGVVILGFNNERTEERIFEKVAKINDNIYCGAAGIASDYSKLLNLSRRISENFLSKYDNYPTIKTICIELAETLQIFTQKTGNRPFGVSMLFCSKEEDGYKLMSTDPSGTFNSWKCKAFGKNDEKVNSAFLSEDLNENITMKEATVKIFKILRKISEINNDDYMKFEVLHFNEDYKGMLRSESVLDLIKESAN